MATAYEKDVFAWANEQAALLRDGRLAEIDVLNIAEEIEDVGKSAKRELRSHMTVLLAHLLQWRYQPTHRGRSWEGTVREQREDVREDLREAPSLKHAFDDEDWLSSLWRRAALQAHKETGLDFPQQWIWSVDQVLDDDFWPD